MVDVPRGYEVVTSLVELLCLLAQFGRCQLWLKVEAMKLGPWKAFCQAMAMASHRVKVWIPRPRNLDCTCVIISGAVAALKQKKVRVPWSMFICHPHHIPKIHEIPSLRKYPKPAPFRFGWWPIFSQPLCSLSREKSAPADFLLDCHGGVPQNRTHHD